MVKGSLAERLEYAILETVVGVFEGHQQDYWGGWETQGVTRGVDRPEFGQPDLLSAFKRVWNRGFLNLTKPNSRRREAYSYSGNQTDDSKFFFTGPFNADVTDEGRGYWDRIREGPRRPIGFSR